MPGLWILLFNNIWRVLDNTMDNSNTYTRTPFIPILPTFIPVLPNIYTNADADSNSDADSDSNSDSNTNTDADADSNTYAYT